MSPSVSTMLERPSFTMRGKTVLIVGGTGFLGRHLQNSLQNYQCGVISHGWSRATIADYKVNLCSFSDCQKLLADTKPDAVFYLAGYNGGIGFNVCNQQDIFFKNVWMGTDLLAACCESQYVQKVVSVVASCAYGEGAPELLLHEQDFFKRMPNSTVLGHGLAKRVLQYASIVASQSGKVFVTACPTTLYGPGDQTDPQKAKVVGSLITKFLRAAHHDKNVILWGNGSSLRELMYVTDAADLLCKTMVNYGDERFPLNLGSGIEVSIKELAKMIARLTNFKGRVLWDEDMPNGQYRKRLSTDRQHQVLGDFVPTSLEKGLRATIDWYRKNIDWAAD